MVLRTTPRFSIIHICYEERFLFLLASLLLYQSLAPFLKSFIGVSLLMNILLTAVLLSAINAISQTRRQGVVVSLLALPMLIATWLSYGLKREGLLSATHVFSILFLVVAMVMIFFPEALITNQRFSASHLQAGMARTATPFSWNSFSWLYVMIRFSLIPK